MQFIEKNSFNVRSAIYLLKRDGTDLEFLVLPMIHVGERRFFDHIGERLASCDLILVEGVVSKRATLLTLSYRAVKVIKRMNLVTQQDGLPMALLRQKTLHADIDQETFDRKFSSLPLSLQLLVFVLLPLYMLYLLFFGTRELIAKHLALEDLPTEDEVLLQDESFDQLDTLLLHERDRLLLKRIQEIYDGNRNNKRIGILFGAAHMRAVVPYLMRRLKFRIASAEWVTVFDL